MLVNGLGRIGGGCWEMLWCWYVVGIWFVGGVVGVVVFG